MSKNEINNDLNSFRRFLFFTRGFKTRSLSFFFMTHHNNEKRMSVNHDCFSESV